MREELIDPIRGAPVLPFPNEAADRILLGGVDPLAAFPGNRFDQSLDGGFHTVAKVVRILRVKLPTTVAIARDEPPVARVLSLIVCRERGKLPHLFEGRRNAPNLDVVAAVIGQAFR